MCWQTWSYQQSTLQVSSYTLPSWHTFLAGPLLLLALCLVETHDTPTDKMCSYDRAGGYTFWLVWNLIQNFFLKKRILGNLCQNFPNKSFSFRFSHWTYCRRNDKLVWNVMMVQALPYRCENQTFINWHERRIETEMKSVRSVAGYRLYQHMTN